ncbi:MAG: hypothetical protein ACXW4B_10820 [Micavibrio sp.]
MMRYSRVAPLVSLIAFMLVLSPAPVHAQADYKELGLRMKNCKSITSLITRSQCYDAVVLDFDLESLNRLDIGKGMGKWKVTTEKSPVDDTQNVFASILGDEYIQNRQGKATKPSLILRCKEQKVEGYILWDEKLGYVDVLVNTRIGKGEQEGARWKLSADKTAAFIPDPTAFAQSLIGQDSLYTSIWIPSADPIATNYDIRGSALALQPLLDACGIKAATKTPPK